MGFERSHHHGPGCSLDSLLFCSLLLLLSHEKESLLFVRISRDETTRLVGLCEIGERTDNWMELRSRSNTSKVMRRRILASKIR